MKKCWRCHKEDSDNEMHYNFGQYFCHVCDEVIANELNDCGKVVLSVI